MLLLLDSKKILQLKTSYKTGVAHAFNPRTRRQKQANLWEFESYLVYILKPCLRKTNKKTCSFAIKLFVMAINYPKSFTFEPITVMWKECLAPVTNSKWTLILRNIPKYNLWGSRDYIFLTYLFWNNTSFKDTEVTLLNIQVCSLVDRAGVSSGSHKT